MSRSWRPLPTLSCASIVQASRLPSFEKVKSATLPTLSSCPLASSRRMRSVPRGRSGNAWDRQSAWRRRRRDLLRRSRLPLQRDPRRRVAREREAANPRVFALLTRCQIDDRHAALHRPALASQPLRLASRRIGRERDPLGILREIERRRCSATGVTAAAGAGSRRRDLADFEGELFLAGFRALHDDLRVTLAWRDAIGEPLAVVRDRGRANRLPGDDVLERDRPALLRR